MTSDEARDVLSRLQNAAHSLERALNLVPPDSDGDADAMGIATRIDIAIDMARKAAQRCETIIHEEVA